MILLYLHLYCKQSSPSRRGAVRRPNTLDLNISKGETTENKHRDMPRAHSLPAIEFMRTTIPRVPPIQSVGSSSYEDIIPWPNCGIPASTVSTRRKWKSTTTAEREYALGGRRSDIFIGCTSLLVCCTLLLGNTGCSRLRVPVYKNLRHPWDWWLICLRSKLKLLANHTGHLNETNLLVLKSKLESAGATTWDRKARFEYRYMG